MRRDGREVERRILTLLHGHNTRTHLKQIHAHFIRHNLHQSNTLLAHFISICGKLRLMPYASLIFVHTQNPNILVFNSMIKGYSISGPSKRPLQIYTLMKCRDIWPDQYTFAPLLKSCTNVTEVSFGRKVHGEIVRVGFELYNGVQIGLVEFYTSCKRMGDAKRVFDMMPVKDVVVWNMMIRGSCKEGNVDMGFHVFQQMRERSNVSWNIMIGGLAQSGRDVVALEVFKQMSDEGFELDDATLVTVLPVCARLGASELGSWIHSYADSRGLFQKFVQVGNSLLDFYHKCDDLEMAWRTFDKMPKKSVVSWNTMISGLAYNGQGKLGLEMFERMSVDPNDATFVGALACCAHTGMVPKGLELFFLMTEKYKIKPRIQHYGCMVDLLGRTGCLKEALELIKGMPMMPNAAIWGALLSACRVHGHLELAEHAVKKLIHLEPWNSGNYVLLSNIYAEQGKWDQVEKARVTMRGKCILKVPGQSTIQ